MQQGSQIRQFLTGRLLMTLLDLPALVIFLPLMAWYSVRLTLVVMAVTLVLAFVVAAMIGPYRRRLRDLYKAEAERQSLLVETVHGMRTVKSLNLEPRREKAWTMPPPRQSAAMFKSEKFPSLPLPFHNSWSRL